MRVPVARKVAEVAITPGPVLCRQVDADRLQEALWRARVARNIAARRSRWFSRNFAVVPS